MITVTPADNSEFLDETLQLKCNEVKAGDIVYPLAKTWSGEGSNDLQITGRRNYFACLFVCFLPHSHSISKDKPKGFYNLWFVNEDTIPVSFRIEVVQKSRGDNYLPIGKIPLGKFYMVAAIVYLALVLIWVFGVLTGSTKTLLLHHLMTGVVLVKMTSVLFLSLDYHYQNIVGHPGGWTVAYYVVNFAKGISIFCIVALIGSGWQLVKPFLSEKDKQIFLFVLPLQILDNIALVILDENLPGMQGWEAWKNVFRLVDIICCGAVIIPIVWSIKHLRDAAQASGKASRNLHKLQLFREYYLLVVAYIYFTRIIVYLFDASLPYNYVWISDVSTEMATVAFFVITGYKFIPEQSNPILKVDSDDEGIEMTEEGTVDFEAVAAKREADRLLEAASVQAAHAAHEEKKKQVTFQADL